MALVLLCGHPCSGKTTVANALRKLLEAEGQTVKIIQDGDDDISGTTSSNTSATTTTTRSELYLDSATEKKTRARLRAATERALNGSTIVLCDSLNYIKGFRYELYCVAKTTGTRYCVISCLPGAEVCKTWDAERERRGEDGYGKTLCCELIGRFEMPAERNRWERPLYMVDVSRDGWEGGLEGVKEGVLRTGRRLVGGVGTRVVEKAGVDVMGLVDRVTREAEAGIVGDLQRGVGVGQRIGVVGGTKMVRLERRPRVAELRDMRRSYLGLVGMHPPMGKGGTELVDEYVEFVNAQLRVSK